MSAGYCARWAKPYPLIQPPHSSTYAVDIISVRSRQGGPNHPIRPSALVPPMIADPIRSNPIRWNQMDIGHTDLGHMDLGQMDLGHKVQGHASEGHHSSQR
jgi:hypothetical protein